MHGSRRWPVWVIALVSVFLYGTSAYILTFNNLLRDVAIDDTFYYYKIVANMARGIHSSFDGLNITNGYHPAWAILLVPLFKWFGTSEAALQAALGLQYALVAGAGAMLAWVAQRRAIRPSLAVVPFFYWLTRPELLIGMEGALHLFALSALFMAAIFWVDGGRPKLSALFLFSSAFVMVWVRLESLLVAFFFVAMLLWGRRKNIPSKEIVGMAMAPVIGAMTYFIYNRLLFGVSIPISGKVKRYMSSVAMAQTGTSLLDNAGEILQSPRVLEGVLTALIVLAVIVFIRRRHPGVQDLPWQAMLVALALTHLAFTAYAIRFLHVSLATASYYFMPLLLLTSVVVLYFGEHALAALERKFSKPRVNVVASALLACVCAYFLLSSLQRLYKQSTNATPDWEILSYRGILWTNGHLPPSSVIGATDAGVMGFYSHHRVVNLDGLVNSAEFFEAMQKQEMDAWLATSSITHLAGVLPQAEDGCRLFATRMRQTNTLRGTCKLIYEGDDHLQHQGVGVKAFRVYEFHGGNTSGN